MFADALFNVSSFDAILQGFAVFAAYLTIASAYIAWIAQTDGLTIAEIADAAGLGLAIAFLPGLVAGGYVYLAVASNGLSPT